LSVAQLASRARNVLDVMAGSGTRARATLLLTQSKALTAVAQRLALDLSPQKLERAVRANVASLEPFIRKRGRFASSSPFPVPRLFKTLAEIASFQQHKLKVLNGWPSVLLQPDGGRVNAHVRPSRRASAPRRRRDIVANYYCIPANESARAHTASATRRGLGGAERAGAASQRTPWSSRVGPE